MKIAVLGTGMVGRAFATRLTGLGHDVVLGTRDPQATLARTVPDDKGTPPLAAWHGQNPHVPLVPLAEAGAHGDLVLNATAGAHALAALELVGAETLAGTVLLDLSLPLDLSAGWPPRLSVVDDDSLGERIQRAVPEARVVKTLNTVQVEIMLDPTRLPGRHHLFVSGDDPGAKALVTALLGELGWPVEAVVDLGDITTARATEMYSRLLFTLSTRYGDFDTNIALVRPEG